MKKLTILLFVAMLLTACGPKPQDLVNAWQDAINKGNVDKALSYLAEDATVTVIPPAEGDGVYNGHEEIRGWYETIIAGKGSGTLSNCTIAGETVTCLDTYTDEGLKGIGVDFLEGDFVAVVRNGMIQSYTFTISPESLAKFPPPPEPTPGPEVRMTSAETIAGKWVAKSGGYTVLHDFRVDGTMVVNVTGIGVIGSGPYVFEDDLLKFQDSTGDCTGLVAEYEVYGTYQEDQLIQLRFVLAGEDLCTDRRKTLAGNTLLPPGP